MKDFAAIDFETANNERSSVCSVGIVIVRNGEIVDRDAPAPNMSDVETERPDIEPLSASDM